MKKVLLVIGGCLSLGLGILGIVVPLLPTTPLVLLSAWCFARSCDRLYNWLISHPRFGQVILNWQNHRGMQAKHKKKALLLTVASLVFSIALAPMNLKILLVVIGICVMTGVSLIRVIPETNGHNN
ncbi:YbaN family protein [Endozoicomonas euniceicola]|uniref:Inner membrane protein n=1 Tax=Endozoicomonas euniceicola TaxID=1234143 RepID=A0ABY6H0X9_9GAMM|nr:YbaN family protein [Endozoicomonas euniceicola]UYM18719.1 YbaN family protein [Endozoicomonas euniceicola]